MRFYEGDVCAREKPLLRDREMAALVAGVQYGLSSHSNFHENKSLIFVKLTDSAQRAIEDFLRNRVSNSYSQFSRSPFSLYAYGIG